MKFIDLHCDTITKIQKLETDFETPGTMDVTLPEMDKAGVCLQVFACCNIGEQSPEQEFETCLEMVKGVKSLVETHKDKLFLVQNTEEAESACLSDDKIGILIAIEGAAALNGDPEKIKFFFDQGVRLLTLAWSDNPFCGSVFGNGSGLTDKGKNLVELCEALGIIVDVSHASDQAFYDLLPIAKRPFVASHSNARTICPNERNLTDDMIHKISDQGGLIGINFASEFLSPETYEQGDEARKIFEAATKAKEIPYDEAMKKIIKIMDKIPRPSIEWIPRHVKHIINHGGEDCVCFGSDFDGIVSKPEGVDGVGSFPKIADHLQKEGLIPRQIEKIYRENAARIFKYLPST
ncbi:dipeptidase [Thermodesulfobacteriota bacterium]